MAPRPTRIARLRDYDDTQRLKSLLGPHNINLDRLAQRLEIEFQARGNAVSIEGERLAVETALNVLDLLWRRLGQGHEIEQGDIDAAIRLAEGGGEDHELSIRTRRKTVQPRSPNQAAYVEALKNHDLVVGLGPAGTGKTYLAVAKAVSMLIRGRVDRIILSRPAVEAGERLGFLPGDFKEKVDPYLRPLYDALHDMLPAEQVAKKMVSGEIEVAPLAFMRGRTLSNAFVILDEAQNASPMQMKMFLTRLGEGARMAVTGDPTQADLPAGEVSGLTDALEILDGMKGVAIVRFSHADVVRHDLVTRLVKAYAARDAKRKVTAHG